MVDASDILIVSASTGTGHARAAEALRQALLLRQPHRVVEHIDLLELAPRWIRAAYGDGYELIATRAPWIWREIYHRTDGPAADHARWGPIAHRMLFREFRRILLSRRWSLCLCTHFLPAQLAAGRAGFPPFALVITDMVLHHCWAQPRVRRYFVASHQVAHELHTRVPEARVDVTGIPVAPCFAARQTAEHARASLGLDDTRPTVLVMGGGLGLGVAENALAAVRAGVPDLQVIAVCGRNAAAAERLRTAGAGAGRLHVYEYVEDVERYIAAADLVVTKPGGLTSSEVLALGRPLILTRPIPGQEEGNARVLCAAGAALEAHSPVEVRQRVEQVFGNGALLMSLAASARNFGQPDAAGAVARALGGERVAVAVA